MITQGRRVYADSMGILRLAEGDYGYNPRADCWKVRPPGCYAGSICEHTVTEHEDGTITVNPSILLESYDGNSGWHGFLERGVWRQV